MRLHNGLAMLMLVLVGAVTLSCGGGDDNAATCTQGNLGCTCFANATCNTGMACANNVCIQPTAGVGGGTSVNTSTTGGATGATTVATCTNTLTDANNCGRCGHVCKSGACANGACSAALGTCINSVSGYTTCTQACAAIGQICVAKGCLGETAHGWIDLLDCSSTTPASGYLSGACSDTIPFATSYGAYKCCCTDN